MLISYNVLWGFGAEAPEQWRGHESERRDDRKEGGSLRCAKSNTDEMSSGLDVPEAGDVTPRRARLLGGRKGPSRKESITDRAALKRTKLRRSSTGLSCTTFGVVDIRGLGFSFLIKTRKKECVCKHNILKVQNNIQNERNPYVILNFCCEHRAHKITCVWCCVVWRGVV